MSTPSTPTVPTREPGYIYIDTDELRAQYAYKQPGDQYWAGVDMKWIDAGTGGFWGNCFYRRPVTSPADLAAQIARAEVALAAEIDSKQQAINALKARREEMERIRVGDWVVCIKDAREGWMDQAIGAMYRVSSLHRDGCLSLEGTKAPAFAYDERRFRRATPAEIDTHLKALAAKAEIKVGDWVVALDRCSLKPGTMFYVEAAPGCYHGGKTLTVRPEPGKGFAETWHDSFFRKATPTEVSTHLAKLEQARIKPGQWVVAKRAHNGTWQPPLKEGQMCYVTAVKETQKDTYVIKWLDAPPVAAPVWGNTDEWDIALFRPATESEIAAHVAQLKAEEEEKGRVKVGDYIVVTSSVIGDPSVCGPVTGAQDPYFYVGGWSYHGNSVRKATPAEVTAHLARLEEERAVTVVGEGNTPYKAVYHVGRVNFGCAYIDNEAIRDAHEFLSRHPSTGGRGNRKVESVKIGAGTFDRETLAKLVANLKD